MPHEYQHDVKQGNSTLAGDIQVGKDQGRAGVSYLSNSRWAGITTCPAHIFDLLVDARRRVSRRRPIEVGLQAAADLQLAANDARFGVRVYFR